MCGHAPASGRQKLGLCIEYLFPSDQAACRASSGRVLVLTQAQVRDRVVEAYVQRGIAPERVFLQSFNRSDVEYWIRHFPAFAPQVVYLDGGDALACSAHETTSEAGTCSLERQMAALRARGLRILAPALWLLVTSSNATSVGDGSKYSPSAYARAAHAARLGLIAWTLERPGPLIQQSPEHAPAAPPALKAFNLSAAEEDGDVYALLHVLVAEARVQAVFSDWPATVTFYANCVPPPPAPSSPGGEGGVADEAGRPVRGGDWEGAGQARAVPVCKGNGQVELAYGSGPYLLLGGVVVAAQVAMEATGRSALRNCQVLLGLAVGYVAAAIASHPSPAPQTAAGDEEPAALRFVSGVARHASRPVLTLPLLSPSSFPLSVHPALIVPLLTCFVITTVETLGDVTATAEASELSDEEREAGGGLDARIQGGLLADGVTSFVACALTSTPTTTMSQNNGVIHMTRCASRRVGYACAGWLLFFGVFSDVSALITSVPNCVLGGMMTLLFAQILVSGIRLLSAEAALPRSRYVIAAGMAFGLGSTLAIPPDWGAGAGDNLLAATLRLVVTTPYCIGTLVALLLHALLPSEPPRL